MIHQAIFDCYIKNGTTETNWSTQAIFDEQKWSGWNDFHEHKWSGVMVNLVSHNSCIPIPHSLPLHNDTKWLCSEPKVSQSRLHAGGANSCVSMRAEDEPNSSISLLSALRK